METTQVMNLATRFNEFIGTEYSNEELVTNKTFLEFAVNEISKISFRPEEDFYSHEETLERGFLASALEVGKEYDLHRAKIGYTTNDHSISTPTLLKLEYDFNTKDLYTLFHFETICILKEHVLEVTKSDIRLGHDEYIRKYFILSDFNSIGELEQVILKSFELGGD